MTLKYKCSLCNRIYNSKRSIYQHFDDSPRHFDEDDDDFESYLELVYDCSKCGREFKSYSNLEHHRMVHLRTTIECLRCDRRFTTYQGMILHLEAGTCPSGIDMLDVNIAAARCPYWRYFMNRTARSIALNDQYIHNLTYYPFKCDGCDKGFDRLSALFMHVWSPACEYQLNEGKIGHLQDCLEENLPWYNP